VHLEVAEKFFGIDPQNVELHCADAREWLRHYRGRKFDMIIDDLFFEQGGEPTRAIEMTRGWANKLIRHLSKQGVLVSNFVDPDHLNNSATVIDPEVTRHFQSAFRLSISRYMNSVGVFLRAFSTTQQLRDNLKKCPGLDPSKSSSRLQYTIRTLY
jgi:spermidine synthase